MEEISFCISLFLVELCCTKLRSERLIAEKLHIAHVANDTSFCVSLFLVELCCTKLRSKSNIALGCSLNRTHSHMDASRISL